MHATWARHALWATLALVSCAAAPTGPTKDGPPTGEPTTASTTAAPTTAEAPSGPKKPSCTDGSCFDCGEGICPTGYYCEASHGAPAACGWAPSCAQKPSCACLDAVVKGCRCEEKNGAPFVTCP